jgi:hypothetical protein
VVRSVDITDIANLLMGEILHTHGATPKVEDVGKFRGTSCKHYKLGNIPEADRGILRGRGKCELAKVLSYLGCKI